MTTAWLRGSRAGLSCSHTTQIPQLVTFRASTGLAAPKSHESRLGPARASQAAESASQTPVETQHERNSKPGQKHNGRNRAVIRASKIGTQRVVELQRPLADYMALPASQYSVLDGRKVERVDEDTFRCYVGELKMFSWTAEPVLTLSVVVEPELGGCTIKLLSCQLRGSKFIEDINEKFGAQMTNVVRWRHVQQGQEDACTDDAASASREERGGDEDDAALPAAASSSGRGATGGKEIVSATELRVELEVPGWCSFLPVASIESVGSNVLQGVLNTMVPRFLAQLEADYAAWASGDSSRKPLGDGSLGNP